MEEIGISIAEASDLLAAQDFYDSRGYGGARIVPTDFVVLAKSRHKLVGVGRLCQEQDLLWLRGMQVEPQFQRQGVGTKILKRLDQEIGDRWCCCLPYEHLVRFYRQADFELAVQDLPAALDSRLAGYLSRGLKVVAMIKFTQSRPNNSFKPTPLRGSA